MAEIKERFSLKDHLFNEAKVRYLSGLLKSGDRSFADKAFVRKVVAKFPELELKARIVHMAEVLEEYLPKKPNEAMSQIVKALPPPLDPKLTDDDFGDFIFAPLGEYVVRNGCIRKYLKQSLKTLEELTMRFSMEDAIRSFLNSFPKETLAQCQRWTKHHNYHVRRLVSEGTRPLLPWSRRVRLSYSDTLPLLNELYDDKTRYVTRSVANHLNDISKTDPELVINTLERWKREGRQDTKEFEWMTKHALRTLIKQGNGEALQLLGYKNDQPILVKSFALAGESRHLEQGEYLNIDCVLSAETDVPVMVDYVIDFIKANGAAKPKVFKWKKIIVKAGEAAILSKRHHLKADATNFKLYPGEHKITLQINGIKYGSLTFVLS